MGSAPRDGTHTVFPIILAEPMAQQEPFAYGKGSKFFYRCYCMWDIFLENFSQLWVYIIDITSRNVGYIFLHLHSEGTATIQHIDKSQNTPYIAAILEITKYYVPL